MTTERSTTQAANETASTEKWSLPPSSTAEILDLANTYGAHNYHPIPIVFSHGKGPYVFDPENNRYLDFLSAYSAVNQGHCHPKILAALQWQASRLSLSSRAFYNDVFGRYAKFITDTFGYDMVLPMNTGAEGVETAIKLARKWGYVRKNIPENEAIVLCVKNNFHGRTIAIISFSSDPDSTEDFGPFVPRIGYRYPAGHEIRYGYLEDLELALKHHGEKVAGFIVEPIQGEAGIVVPPDGYLKNCYDLCKRHNVLFIADEIQTGLGRTGRMLACDHENVHPDILILGKALSGGVYPVSAVLASRDIMLCIKPGEHGSTYGGNPLGSAVAMAAVQVILDEGMLENAEKMGKLFRKEIENFKSPLVSIVRGKGLLNAIVIDESKLDSGKSAWHICLLLKKYGLLAKPTHQNIIRLAPPLCITESELMEGIAIIKRALTDIVTINKEDIPDVGL